jgi:4-nitrophenyl phosphatase
MQSLDNIHAFIIDMDGVLWHGSKPLPGLNEFFDTLNTLNIRFILATNNASQTPEQYVTKLAAMGIDIKLKQILTSGMATAQYLADQFDPINTRVFVVGEDGATQPLLEQGFTLTGLYEQNADIVVCGKDSTLTWDKLATASLNISTGARFFGTNADTTLPTERGVTLGNGAILKALEVATGISATVIGKPEPIFYQQALALLNTRPEYTVAIGDRLETDILGAVRTGIRSLMVLTGISSESDLASCTYHPTWVMADLNAISQALKSAKVQ